MRWKFEHVYLKFQTDTSLTKSKLQLKSNQNYLNRMENNIRLFTWQWCDNQLQTAGKIARNEHKFIFTSCHSYADSQF